MIQQGSWPINAFETIRVFQNKSEFKVFLTVGEKTQEVTSQFLNKIPQQVLQNFAHLSSFLDQSRILRDGLGDFLFHGRLKGGMNRDWNYESRDFSSTSRSGEHTTPGGHNPYSDSSWGNVSNYAGNSRGESSEGGRNNNSSNYHFDNRSGNNQSSRVKANQNTVPNQKKPKTTTHDEKKVRHQHEHSSSEVLKEVGMEVAIHTSAKKIGEAVAGHTGKALGEGGAMLLTVQTLGEGDNPPVPEKLVQATTKQIKDNFSYDSSEVSEEDSEASDSSDNTHSNKGRSVGGSAQKKSDDKCLIQ